MSARAVARSWPALCVLAASAAHAADAPLRSFEGSVPREYFGMIVAGVGDVNGDERDDVLVGAPGAEVGGREKAGFVVLYSGADGSEIRRHTGPPNHLFFGTSIAAAGDLNGDEVPDYAIAALTVDDGATSTGAIFTFSGADGSALWQKVGSDPGGILGRSLAGAGDVNKDGHDDLVAGSPFSSPGGLAAAGDAFVWSGADGSELFHVSGELAGDQVGWSVAGLGDLDDDGHGDFAIASPHTSPNNQLRSGSVWAYSGADFRLLFRHDGTRPLDYFGFSLVGIGDADGDTIPDLAAGSPNADPQGREVAGSAYVLSGDGGVILVVVHGEAAYDYLGTAVAPAGDVDGDGLADIAVSAPHADPGGVSQSGAVRVFSAVSGRLVRRIEGTQLGGLLGYSIANAGDVNGDGLSDLIVGEPNHHLDDGAVPRAGAAHIYAGACIDADGDGWGTANPPICSQGLDCDDSNPSVNPGATEVPGNGLDDDCDPSTPDGEIGCSSPRGIPGIGSLVVVGLVLARRRRGGAADVGVPPP